MISNAIQQMAQAARESTLQVVGYKDVANEAQAFVAASLLKAYKGATGFMYLEAAGLDEIERPGDVMLCHPEVGLLVVEVKAYSINFIQRIMGNNLVVKYRDQPIESQINPAHQAQQVLLSVKKRARAELIQAGIKSYPLFNWIIALPNIKASEWRDRGYDSSIPEEYILFQEHFTRPERLRERLHHLLQHKTQDKSLNFPLRPEHIEPIKRAVGDSDAIAKARPPRIERDIKSLGAYFDELLSIERHLSEEQMVLARLLMNGYPRLIRGVAGSGKSVVLTKIIARYLCRELIKPQDMFEQSPEKYRVALVCFNRALVPMLQARIQQDYETMAHTPLPDEGTLSISHLNGLMERHAWRDGNRKTDDQVMPYIKITDDMKDSAKRAQAYRQQLIQSPLPVLYDAIFVDEGQDLEPEEYELLLEMLKPDATTGEKNLIIFYDDAQNLYGRNRPNWKDIGLNLGGKRARVMTECYRNTQEVVELGLNVLLGSQAPDDVRVQTRTYTNINYLEQNELVKDLGDHVRVKFTKRTFRKPSVARFPNREAEIQYVVQEIRRLLLEEKVRPEDILILFSSEWQFGTLSDRIAKALPKNYLRGFIKPYEAKDKNRYIFEPDHLTISTVHGAKGYDAQIVMLIGVDRFDVDTKGRATFYVGATRAKMVLYVTGVTSDEPSLLDEAERVNEMI